MNTKILTKVFASILAFIMSFANLTLVGSYMDKTYAASEDLEQQATSVKKAEIEFDAYFEENGKNVHSKTIDVNSEGEILKLSFKVEDGYLASGKVKIDGANFKVQETDEELVSVQSISSENNEIVLNQIGKDESVILSIPVKINADSSFDAKNLSKLASVKLEGVYVNNKGKEIKIEKTIEIKTTLDGTADSNLSERLTKYVPFEVNGQKGVILQTLIESNLIDNKLPVKSNVLEIEIPTINKLSPKVITLSAKSLKATSGEDVKVFGENDYKVEDGKIILTLNNNNDVLSWNKDAKDEIVLTCVYGEEASNFNGEINLSAKSKISYYGKEVKTSEKEFSDKVQVNGKVGEIITFETEVSENELYKGYMMTQGGKHTEFSNVISLDIGYHEIMDKISFKDEIQYVDKNGNIFPSSAAYTYSKVSKDNLVQILGEDGYINVYDSNNKLITTLNKDNLEYKYEGITAGLSFETSKPVEEGILKLENGRSILPLEYSKVQEESFANIKVNIKGNIIKDDQTIISSNGEKTIELKDAMSKAELELSNSNLSTIVKNDGVGMRITLDTNDMSTKLYKNPEINITFPSYVSNVKVENVKLVYEKELKIESAKLYKNDAGNIEIGIKLQGEQTAYNEEYNADGAMLVMNADITTDKLTPAKADNIHLKVKNENADETVENNAEVKFVAPAGIAAISEVSGYSDKEQNAISINGTKEIGKIEENASAKEATMKIIAMNNYDYSCNNIVILGRTPFAGNKSIEGQKDLGSTFDAKMIGEIASENADLSNMTVYYSANKTANKNLEDRQNGWTTNRNEVENVASYMIVLNDFEFKAGEMLTFTYKIQIPENISKNQQTFGTFGVYYETTMGDDVVRTISLPTTYVEGTPVGIATEVGVELKVTLQSNLEEGHSIQVGENITYTAKVENLSSIKAENVKLKIYMSKNTVFVKTDGTHDGGGINRTIILDVGDIEGNSSKNVVFTLNVTSYDTSEDEQMEALIKSYEEEQEKIKEEEERIAKEEEEKGYSEEQKQAAAKAREEAKWGKPGDDNYEELQQQKKEYEETQKNIKKYIEEYKNRNKITTKVTVYTEADANTEYGSDGSVGEGDVGQSGNQNSQNVNPNPSQGSSIADLRLNLSTMQDGILSEGQDVICTLRVTQNTTKELSNVKLTCVIPEGLTFKKASNAEKYDYNPDTRTVTYTFDKMVGAKTMTLICSVDKLPAGSYEKQYDIAFSGTYDGLDRDPYQSNVISMTAYRDGFSISQNSSVSSGVLYEGDKITYNIIVNNLTSKDTIATVYDVLPNELQFEEGYYTQDEVQRGITSAGANNIRTDLVLKANEQLILHIVAKVKEVNNTPVKITNKVYLTSTDIERLDANDISHTIYKKGDVVDPNNPNNPNDPNNPNGQGGDEKNGYTISGVAWIDEDKDGLREDNEQLLENIKVYLLNSRTNAVISETQTNKNGVYEFKGVKNGSYVVAFDYDNNQYEVTVYQAENAGDSVNSDAIKMELTIKGNSKEYALTNTLVINDNQYNIDLGLTYNRKFELSVNKGISLVQLTNANGTKNYNFNDGDAKIEIPEKYIDSSTIAITYKITIKNTGTIPGYVGKVVDYKARDLDFNSALNPEWYEDSNGNLYNTSLAGRVINPGETVELSIILTKTVNGENIGISNNTAEIAEASNDYGIPLSTTPGNKNGTEADLGSCDIIVAVQSGGIIFYGGILLLVLAIFALRWIYNK